MQKTYSEVSDYYNKLWADLEKENKAGINSRHRAVMQRLKKAGLKNNSVVLEIGCGIGAISGLILKNIPNGYFVGADISNETIDFVRKKYSHCQNAEFVVSDMTNFTHSRKFDFIVLPDVLEHIPKEAHGNIFKTIRSLIKDEGTVFINIPEPRFLEWFHKYQPQDLQIIDQPLHTDELLNSIYPNGFYLEGLETYSLYFSEPDYQSLILKPKKEIWMLTRKSKISVFLHGLKLRIL